MEEKISAPLRHTLNEKQLLILEDVNKYQLQVEEKCNAMLIAARNEAEILKQKLYADTAAEKEQYNLRLKEQNYNHISAFLDRINNNIVQIISNILDKFNIGGYSAEQLYSLVKNELSATLKLNDFKIYVNSAQIEQIKQLFSSTGQNNIEYIADDSIAVNQCKIESTDALVEFDFERAKESIREMLVATLNF